MEKKRTTAFEALPDDVKIFFSSVEKLLLLYLPSSNRCEPITMMVGRNVTATLTLNGGPLTREVIEDVLAHLAFYKRYFPKTEQGPVRSETVEEIMTSMKAAWEAHYETARQKGLLPNADQEPAP